MSCISTILLSIGSRIAIICWWLLDPRIIQQAFKNWGIQGTVPIPTWVWPVLGVIFLPWTTLAYLFFFPEGITGYEWAILIIGLVIDLAGHGGSYSQRRRFSKRK